MVDNRNITNTIRLTRAALNTLQSGSGIVPGLIYVITDENRIAVGTAVNAYETYAKESETGGGESVNFEALTADKTLTASDATVQVYTFTADRTVNLPTTGLTTGAKFIIWNNNAYNSTYYLLVKQSTTTLGLLYAQKKSDFYWDGTNWCYNDKDNTSVGYNAKGTFNGVAVGLNANGYYNGVAVGQYANGSSYGAAVGQNASGSSYGAAVGQNASGSSYGAAVGQNANGSTVGAAVGYNANGSNNGAAVGNEANANTYGAAIGIGANGYGNGAAIGRNATTNSKLSNTAVCGAYSKAERNREFVSTGTASTTNKAQLTIQKYVEKSLSSASAAWQELFIDGSSARLTIIASSVYHFMAQINAIDRTNFNVKTWELKGAIKRNASNGTSIVGTVTKTVTASDSGTEAWDVQITADDTNEALKVEVKHDSANTVQYSLNIFATETRI